MHYPFTHTNYPWHHWSQLINVPQNKFILLGHYKKPIKLDESKIARLVLVQWYAFPFIITDKLFYFWKYCLKNMILISNLVFNMLILNLYLLLYKFKIYNFILMAALSWDNPLNFDHKIRKLYHKKIQMAKSNIKV